VTIVRETKQLLILITAWGKFLPHG